MKKSIQAICGVVLSTIFVTGVWAEGHSAKGVVNAIKSADRKLTISHGPISGLGMGAMTMDFKVMDPAMLDDVTKGHKVAFVVEKDKSGDLMIMDIEDLGAAKDMKMSEDHSGEHMDGHKH